MWGFWVLLLLFALLILSAPSYPYSRNWGYGPTGAFLLLLIFWVALIYFGWVAFWWPWSATP